MVMISCFLILMKKAQKMHSSSRELDLMEKISHFDFKERYFTRYAVEIFFRWRWIKVKYFN
jgi:hypothetical protein